MTEDDRRRWDARHHARGAATDDDVGLPPPFAAHAGLFPTAGHALDLACGRGGCSVWLARRGLRVTGVDVSPVAIALARELATRHGVADRCTFEVGDLDAGLPDGPPGDVVMCHLFRDARLDDAIVQRLAPGGVLAVAALSEGAFRAGRGELRDAFAALDVLAGGEADGRTWLLARRPDARA